MLWLLSKHILYRLGIENTKDFQRYKLFVSFVEDSCGGKMAERKYQRNLKEKFRRPKIGCNESSVMARRFISNLKSSVGEAGVLCAMGQVVLVHILRNWIDITFWANRVSSDPAEEDPFCARSVELSSQPLSVGYAGTLCLLWSSIGTSVCHSRSNCMVYYCFHTDLGASTELCSINLDAHQLMCDHLT